VEGESTHFLLQNSPRAGLNRHGLRAGLPKGSGFWAIESEIYFQQLLG
jgi:hypothetical protein